MEPSTTTSHVTRIRATSPSLALNQGGWHPVDTRMLRLQSTRLDDEIDGVAPDDERQSAQRVPLPGRVAFCGHKRLWTDWHDDLPRRLRQAVCVLAGRHGGDDTTPQTRSYRDCAMRRAGL